MVMANAQSRMPMRSGRRGRAAGRRGGDGDGYHTYASLDRFGRVVDQRWTNAAKTATLDEYAYTYDLAGNRTPRTNALSATLSETYAYDGLNRLIDTDRGEGERQDDFQS